MALAKWSHIQFRVHHYYLGTREDHLVLLLKIHPCYLLRLLHPDHVPVELLSVTIKKPNLKLWLSRLQPRHDYRQAALVELEL
jgi:hypothetical protein